MRGGLVDDDPTPPESMPAMASAEPFAPHRAPPPPPPAGCWRFRTMAGEEGPYDLETVKNLVRTDAIHPDDQALAPGDDSWQRAGDIAALARYFKLRQVAGAAPTTGPAACFKHPRTRGRWLCSGCGTLSCDECVAEHVAQRVVVKLCPRCRKAVTELVATKVIVPFWKDVPALLAFPIKGNGWLAMILCALVGAAANVSGSAPGILALAYWMLTLSILTYHLLIIRTAAAGKPGLPNLGGIENFRTDLVWPGAKASIVTLLVFVGPFVMNVMWANPAEDMVAGRQLAVENARDGREAAARSLDLESMRERDDETAGTDPGASDQQRARKEGEDALHDHLAENGWLDEPNSGLGLEDAKNVPDVDWDLEVNNARRALESAKSTALTRNMMVWALTLLAATLWPLLLIIVALFNTIVPVFRPNILLKIIREIQHEYSICVVFTIGLLLLAQVVSLPIILSTNGVFTAQANPLAYYFAFIAFHVMGRTAEMAEQKIDWS
jgi:hypothetical protein